MKKKNKILLSILSVFLLIGIVNVSAITVGSETGSADPNSKIITDTATLSITGVVSEDQFRVFKILDAFYNDSTNVITYEFTDEFQAFLNNSSNATYQKLKVDDLYSYSSGSITTGSTLSNSDIDKLASAYAGYIKAHDVDGTQMAVSDTTASATLQAGSYLVLPIATSRVYAVMLGNLDFTASNNTWAINNEEIVAKVSDADISKSIGEEGYDSGSYSIGDDIPFIITGSVPQYPTNATNKVYTITDTLSAGLDFTGISSVVIKDGDTALTTSSDGKVTNAGGQEVAVISITGRVMTITFDVNYVNSTTITVNYTARLNENAGLGVNGGNTNSASLTYSNDPYGTGTSTTVPEEGDGQVDILVYGLEIYKYATNGGAALEDAEFTIYKDVDLQQVIDVVTTDSNGIAQYKGLAAGTYYIKETKAPTGYRLDNSIISVKIGPGEGSLEPAETEGYYRLEVANNEAGLLPVTGGVGTIVFTLVGLAIIAGAFYFFFVYRKKNEQQEDK